MGESVAEDPYYETENMLIQTSNKSSNVYSIMHPSLYELSDSDDDSIQSLIFRLKQSSLFAPTNKIHIQPVQPDESMDNELVSIHGLERILVSNHQLQFSNGYDIKGGEMCSLTQLGSDRPRSSSPSLPSFPYAPSRSLLDITSESRGLAESISESGSAAVVLNGNLLDEISPDSYTSLHMYQWSQQPPHTVGPSEISSSFYELSNSDSDATIDAVVMRAKAFTRQVRSGGHAILVGDEVVVSSLSNSSVSSELDSVSERVESCFSDSSDNDSDD